MVPYQSTFPYTGSILIGSYFNPTDSELFVTGSNPDFWYGSSENDVVELGVYDIQSNLVSWGAFDQGKKFKEIKLSFLNEKDIPVEYVCKELIRNFNLYKNESILLDVSGHLDSFKVPPGEYILSYNFTRYLVGNSEKTLSIKDISPSRKEIKLIPTGIITPEFEAFCKKQFVIKEISPLYIINTKQCPYDKILSSVNADYSLEINNLKHVFFLNNDGQLVDFLKTLYEDKITYTSPPVGSSEVPEKISRSQGIRSYFHNDLLFNSEKVSTFDELLIKFSGYVKKVVLSRLSHLKSEEFKSTLEFLNKFFIDFYFVPIHEKLSKSFKEKYLSLAKNCLNFGNGNVSLILNHDFGIENGQLVLYVKLSKELSDQVTIKSRCWISNHSLNPFVLTTVFKDSSKNKTFRISPPNFSLDQTVSISSNDNKWYSYDNLELDFDTERNVKLSKETARVSVDYSDFSNFIIFSSAELRLGVFKNKMIKYSSLSSSLVQLEQKQSQSISSGSTFPYYLSEKTSLQDELNDLISSFDGYESYLYNKGNYFYNNSSNTFYNNSYVNDQDELARVYDKNNLDSFVKNTPEYIVKDSNFDDYLIFLSMVGHHFDNIYVYIKGLPSVGKIENVNTDFIPSTLLQKTLSSLGWKIEDSLDQSDLEKYYLNNLSNSNLNSLSDQERSRLIWNRLLVNLPQIYKTKGTEECVKLILSCYGIPSTILSIREYGGINSDVSQSLYTQQEKIFMLRFNRNNEYIGDFPSSGSFGKSLEFKFSFDSASSYQIEQSIPLVKKFIGNSLAWELGAIRTKGNVLGRFYFTLSGSKLETNPAIPIFDGTIYSVLLRQNNPDIRFEYTSDYSSVPSKYDLFVRKNDEGRSNFVSSASVILSETYNRTFSGNGYMVIGNYDSNLFAGTLDKVLIWKDSISDDSFEDHVNNINSYSYTGSMFSPEALLFRMNYDYPEDLSVPGASILNRNEYHFQINQSSSFRSVSANNFPKLSISSSQNLTDCSWIEHSVYPYQFREIELDQTYTVSNYGPSRLKNNKIRKHEFVVESRLDPDDRSTRNYPEQIAVDSNKIGLFVDPQDYKNKDIIRYFGNRNIMDSVANPGSLYSSSYDGLKQLNREFVNSSDKRVFFNELITLYKLYFDKSVFKTIKSLLPARSSILTGLLIEPSILERPKYQHKPLNVTPSKVCVSGSIKDMVEIIPSIISANFNILDVENNESIRNSYPKNLNLKLDLKSISYPVRTYYNQSMYGHITEKSEINDYTAYDNSRLEKYGIANDSGSYLIKVWRRYPVYHKSGSYERNMNPKDNWYSASFISIYTIEKVSEKFFKTIFYTEETVTDTDLSSIPKDSGYLHKAYTAKGTDNNTVSVDGFGVDILNNQFKFEKPHSIYYEIFKGYPRNHYEHKSRMFSPEKAPAIVPDGKIYVKSRQTSYTTIGKDGLENGSSPIESTNVSNVNVVKSENVLNR